METQEIVNVRLAHYAVTLDARDLWPDVRVAAFQSAQAELARVTAAVLSDTLRPVRLELPPQSDPRAVGVAASAAGIGPLLGLWCETGRVNAPHAVADLVATHLDHGRRRAARLRHELDRLLVALDERQVQVLVLKGMDTGRRYFPEPGTRPVADIDLLVSPADLRQARAALAGLGYVETPSTQPHRSHWTPPSVGPVRSLEFTHADDPWSLDLHTSLDRRQFGGVTMVLAGCDLSSGEVLEEYARPVRVLPQPQLLAYLALHTSSHFYSMSLLRLVELVLVVRRDYAGRPDRWSAFRELVRRTGAGRFVFPALTLADRLAPGTIDPLVLAELAAAAPARLRQRVQELTPASAQQLHPYPLRELFVWATSLREIIGELVEVAWPHEGDRLASPRQALNVNWRRFQLRWWRLRSRARLSSLARDQAERAH
jgi:Uncharacterised nucleotidyltransferase